MGKKKKRMRFLSFVSVLNGSEEQKDERRRRITHSWLTALCYLTSVVMWWAAIFKIWGGGGSEKLNQMSKTERKLKG